MLKSASLRTIIAQTVFWAGALLITAGTYNFARDVTACWRLTSLPGIPATNCSGEKVIPIATPVLGGEPTAILPTDTAEPEIAPETEYPTWDGASRINILFVGLRGGEPTAQDCPFCTDTLILMTVDPVTKTAGMLSLPRDLWVNIPGFGYSRINTAWTLGRGSKLPGGGPGLTMKTVSHFIGVPVDYYVQVDFDTFVDFIDMIGGVDIYNNENLWLDPVYHGQEFPKVKLTCCGERHLNGRVALAYARCRHIEQGCANGDIGRAERQQKVIFAIRDKVLDPETFPTLFAQAPKLYNTFSEGIHTNMTLDDAMRLAVLVRDIPRAEIKHAVIDENMMVLDSVILNGQKASIIRPYQDKVRLLRDEIFTSSGALRPLAQGDETTLMQLDQARVRVLNGTSRPQFDTQAGDFLTQKGVLVTEYGTVKAQGRTTIILYSPKVYTLRFLVRLFEITRSAQIIIDPDPSETVDIEIRLGADWTSKLPAP